VQAFPPLVEVAPFTRRYLEIAPAFVVSGRSDTCLPTLVLALFFVRAPRCMAVQGVFAGSLCRLVSKPRLVRAAESARGCYHRFQFLSLEAPLEFKGMGWAPTPPRRLSLGAKGSVPDTPFHISLRLVLQPPLCLDDRGFFVFTPECVIYGF